MSQISAIISDWDNSDDATFSDLDQIIEIIQKADELLRDVSEIIKFIGYWMKGGDYVNILIIEIFSGGLKEMVRISCSPHSRQYTVFKYYSKDLLENFLQNYLYENYINNNN